MQRIYSLIDLEAFPKHTNTVWPESNVKNPRNTNMREGGRERVKKLLTAEWAGSSSGKCHGGQVNQSLVDQGSMASRKSLREKK